MVDSDLDLHAIVARATFLRERLLRVESPEVRPLATVQQLLDRWRSAVEPDGADWFGKRLRWAGRDPTTLASALADDAPEPGGPLPDWALVLRDLSASARSRGAATLDPSPLDPEVPLPFEDLLLPAVIVGRSLLCSRLGPTADPLRFPILGIVSAEAYRDLERALLSRLSGIAGQTLQSELRRSRPIGSSLSAMLDLPELEGAADTEYRKFVDEHLRNGWVALIRHYPVLGRLIATAVELWADSTAELLGRLRADGDELAGTFGLEGTPLKVSGFDVYLGDPHRGGRSVTLVKFAGGGRVVYKPKPLALEGAFNRLLEWCNRRGASPSFKVTTVLDRHAYGWVEYLEALPCEDQAAAKRFYRRAGMLLCLLHVVRATDCHYENLIAHGDQPVLIDAETLLYPDPQPLEEFLGSEPGERVGDRLLTGTVLRTGLLPGWQAGADQAPHDRSGLGRMGSDAASRDSMQWTRINTDDMDVRLGRGVEAGRNVARIGDRPLSPLHYEAQLTEGFESMYRLLIAHRDALSADDSPLAAMRAQPVRFMYRPTRVYGALMAGSWRPDVVRSGLEYGIYLEQLARAFLVSRDKPTAWPVLDAEIRALEHMDVPLFSARTDSADLDLDDGTRIRNAFTKPSHDAMRELVAAMSEVDLERQLLVIRAALQAKAARAPSGKADHHQPHVAASSPLSIGELIHAATEIGLEIERHALPDGRNAVNWIGLNYLEDSDHYQLDALGDSLYDGCCGVALFLAALSSVTGDRRFASLALRSVNRLRGRLRDTDPGSRRVVAHLHGLGGAVGLGSLIYSLVRISGLLDGDDAGILDDAAGLAEWLTPDVIVDDDKLDVMSGAAGALLGLLALYSAGGQPRVLETAIDCGEHLLQHRVDANGRRAWRTVAEQPLTGFSHGAAGIAYALVRLYAVTGDRSYLDAAVEGMEFERSVFCEPEGNWPDLRPPGAADPNGYPVKWCHGAAGIALGRLGCRRIADLPGVEREVDAGLRATRERYLQDDADFLCCGNLGRAETFLVAADVTGELTWQWLAASGAASVLRRAAQNRGYRLFAAAGYNPGFFHGTAGIGYQLLRLADDELPSVLLWE